eukprot:6299530-Heterocapsa_arctica.AAC.1
MAPAAIKDRTDGSSARVEPRGPEMRWEAAAGRGSSRDSQRSEMRSLMAARSARGSPAEWSRIPQEDGSP